MRTNKFFHNFRVACSFKNKLKNKDSALIFQVYRPMQIRKAPVIGYYVFYNTNN